MKSWMKVLLGLTAGAAIGVGASFLGKKHNNNDDEYVEITEGECCDSDSDE